MTTKRNVCVGTLACVGTFVCAGTLERRPDQVSGTLQDDRLKHARGEAPLRPRKNPASATIETILADIGTINTHVIQHLFFFKVFLQNAPQTGLSDSALSIIRRR